MDYLSRSACVVLLAGFILGSASGGTVEDGAAALAARAEPSLSAVDRRLLLRAASRASTRHQHVFLAAIERRGKGLRGEEHAGLGSQGGEGGHFRSDELLQTVHVRLASRR